MSILSQCSNEKRIKDAGVESVRGQAHWAIRPRRIEMSGPMTIRGWDLFGSGP